MNDIELLDEINHLCKIAKRKGYVSTFEHLALAAGELERALTPRRKEL